MDLVLRSAWLLAYSHIACKGRSPVWVWVVCPRVLSLNEEALLTSWRNKKGRIREYDVSGKKNERHSVIREEQSFLWTGDEERKAQAPCFGELGARHP